MNREADDGNKIRSKETIYSMARQYHLKIEIKISHLKFYENAWSTSDFIVIDSLSQAVDLNSEKIKFLANRNLGVGCDQVLIIEPPKN